MQFYFSDQCLDTDRRELYRDSQRVELQPQVFDVLVYLVQNSDRVVSRDDLISAIWNGRIVSESTLTSRINAARRAIGDNGFDQRLIRTIPRKGFLFTGALQSQPQAEPSTPLALDKPAVAVLPFKNISGESEQDYFSEGISDDIITALSKIRWFYVIARNSSFNYKGQSIPLKEVGEQLGVGYVVEGSVRKEGERVRISVQLSNVSTGI